jgi:hypothetical protein
LQPVSRLLVRDLLDVAAFWRSLTATPLGGAHFDAIQAKPANMQIMAPAAFPPAS